MNAFVDEHRDRYGVESICRVVQIAPTGYYLHAARARQPERRSTRAQQDELLCEDIKRVWEDNMRCYSVVKVWKQLRRDSVQVARCPVARLMRHLGLQGVRRGQVVRTTVLMAAPVPYKDRIKLHLPSACPVKGLLHPVSELLYLVHPPPLRS